MICPSCGTRLVMSDRSGIEIDYCSNCRGVWLDRGELDKIVERSQPDSSLSSRHRDDRDEDDRDARHRPRKKKSFLGDLFDF